MLPKDFFSQLLDALMQVLSALLKILLLPFNLWVKSITNLSKQRKHGLLDLNAITGLWPFFTFCKRLLLDFILDAVAFLSYPFGILAAMVCFVVACVESSSYYLIDTIIDAVLLFSVVLAMAYLTPVFTTIVNNSVQFLLLPILKLIDWFKKPAQQIDVNLNKKEQEVKPEEGVADNA